MGLQSLTSSLPDDFTYTSIPPPLRRSLPARAAPRDIDSKVKRTFKRQVSEPKLAVIPRKKVSKPRDRMNRTVTFPVSASTSKRRPKKLPPLPPLKKRVFFDTSITEEELRDFDRPRSACRKPPRLINSPYGSPTEWFHRRVGEIFVEQNLQKIPFYDNEEAEFYLDDLIAEGMTFGSTQTAIVYHMEQRFEEITFYSKRPGRKMVKMMSSPLRHKEGFALYDNLINCLMQGTLEEVIDFISRYTVHTDFGELLEDLRMHHIVYAREESPDKVLNDQFLIGNTFGSSKAAIICASDEDYHVYLYAKLKGGVRIKMKIIRTAELGVYQLINHEEIAVFQGNIQSIKRQLKDLLIHFTDKEQFRELRNHGVWRVPNKRQSIRDALNRLISVGKKGALGMVYTFSKGRFKLYVKIRGKKRVAFRIHPSSAVGVFSLCNLKNERIAKGPLEIILDRAKQLARTGVTS